MGQDTDFPETGVGMPSNLGAPHQRVIGTSSSSKDVLLQGAIESHVLVKNDGVLPLKSPQLISLFGYSAKTPDAYTVGITGVNGGQWALSTEEISELSTDPDASDQIASEGILISGGGSGANQPAYVSSAFDALSQRAYDDGTHLMWDFHFANKSKIEVDQTSDACIVNVNAFATEGADRAGQVLVPRDACTRVADD